MRMPPPITENQNSSLLSTEENLQIFKLLGNRCLTIATTVVQLFTTTPPNHTQWVKRETGVLCFVRDNSKKNFFFRLFSLKMNQMVWEHEMYNNMEYVESAPFFHIFEGEEYIVAFNFANQTEARQFKAIVDQKIEVKRRKEEKKARQVSQTPTLKLPQKNLDFNTKQHIRKEKRKRNITKADISTPMDFVHVSHVGFHPDTGFDVLSEDTNLKSLFQRAGVSEKQLQNKKTRDFIYDFIGKYPDRDSEPNLPTVPPRGTPRPSSANPRPAPPPPPIHRIPSSHENNAPRKSRPPSPPKHLVGGGGPAPPPPPPPMMDAVPPPPPPMMMESGAPSAPSMPDGNSALLQSIRDGTTLKPVENRQPAPAAEDARGDLLSAIRKGIQLKPVDEREMKPQNPSPTSTGENDLASALKQALLERSKVFQSEDEDDDTSSSSNDDDWDD